MPDETVYQNNTYHTTYHTAYYTAYHSTAYHPKHRLLLLRKKLRSTETSTEKFPVLNHPFPPIPTIGAHHQNHPFHKVTSNPTMLHFLTNHHPLPTPPTTYTIHSNNHHPPSTTHHPLPTTHTHPHPTTPHPTSHTHAATSPPFPKSACLVRLHTAHRPTSGQSSDGHAHARDGE